MTKAAKTVSAARPSPTESAASTPADDSRLKLQALAAPRSSEAGRTNWELRALGVLGFELVSARG
jgi:hypothetical protein